jgi:hypothetical protein
LPRQNAICRLAPLSKRKPSASTVDVGSNEHHAHHD